MGKHSADAILDLQLGIVVGQGAMWVNEHIMSSWCHLRIESASGPLVLNFTLKKHNLIVFFSSQIIISK